MQKGDMLLFWFVYGVQKQIKSFLFQCFVIMLILCSALYLIKQMPLSQVNKNCDYLSKTIPQSKVRGKWENECSSASM